MLAQIVVLRLKIVVRAWRSQLTFGIEKGRRLGGQADRELCDRNCEGFLFRLVGR